MASGRGAFGSSRTWWVVALLAGAAFSLYGADWFVTPSGAGSGAQNSPCSLATALTSASAGDVLYLGEGSYTGDMGGNVASVSVSLSLLGGWDGAASGTPSRDPAGHPSVLDGGGVRRVMVVAPGLDVTLDGLTLSNGYIEGEGGGLYCSGSDLTVVDCAFEANGSYRPDGADGHGGAIRFVGGDLEVLSTRFYQNWAACVGCGSTYGGGLDATTPGTVTVRDCLFEENDAWHGSGLSSIGTGGGVLEVRDTSFTDNGKGDSGGASGGYGGGAYLANVDATLTGCSFLGNNAANEGGALRMAGSPLAVLVDQSWIMDNSAIRAPGVQVLSGTLTLINSVVARNRADWLLSGGLMVRSSGHALVDHVTFAENTNDAGGYAVEILSSGGADVTNAIVAAHSAGFFADAGTAMTADGILWGTGAWANDAETAGDGTVTLGTTTVSGDPDFVDAAAGDYHIGAASAARDAGIDTGVHHDIDGQGRPNGAAVDIGADEYVPPPAVSAVLKLGNPFRIKVLGSNLQEGIRVFIDGAEWPTIKWKNETKIVIKKGSALKALVPKNTAVTLRFVNPDGGEATLAWQWP
jgi:hypothetical protein